MCEDDDDDANTTCHHGVSFDEDCEACERETEQEYERDFKADDGDADDRG